jgi:hypothetical protein
MPALTYVPLPTARNLVAALVNQTLPDNELSAPWRRSGDEAFWFSLSAWSLLAIAQWRQCLTGQPSITVWLPDFFCNSSLSLPPAQHGGTVAVLSAHRSDGARPGCLLNPG